jgi:hypothetical protein
MKKIVSAYFEIRREFPELPPNACWHKACEVFGNDFSEAP